MKRFFALSSLFIFIFIFSGIASADNEDVPPVHTHYLPMDYGVCTCPWPEWPTYYYSEVTGCETVSIEGFGRWVSFTTCTHGLDPDTPQCPQCDAYENHEGLCESSVHGINPVTNSYFYPYYTCQEVHNSTVCVGLTDASNYCQNCDGSGCSSCD